MRRPGPNGGHMTAYQVRKTFFVFCIGHMEEGLSIFKQRFSYFTVLQKWFPNRGESRKCSRGGGDKLKCIAKIAELCTILKSRCIRPRGGGG